METLPPLRLAVLGAGLIGREHVALLRRHPAVRLVAIADATPQGRALAEACGARCHDDYATLLEQESIDAAVVALPNQLHLDAGLRCIRRGVAVLMEKPVADTVSAALQLADAAEAAGVPVLVGHQRRHSPDIVAARACIARGELGPLVAVNGMWWMDKDERYFDAAWRREPGGGPLLINLIHDIDCLRHLCGDVASVQAMLGHQARGFAVEDTAAVLMRFGSGALGTFSLSDSVASPYGWDASSGQALYFPCQRENCYFIGGRTGSLAVPTLAHWRHEGPGAWQDPLVRLQVPVAIGNAYERQLDHFVQVVRRQAAPLIDARDAAHTLATLEAIRQAGRSGQPVDVAQVLRDAARPSPA